MKLIAITAIDDGKTLIAPGQIFDRPKKAAADLIKSEAAAAYTPEPIPEPAPSAAADPDETPENPDPETDPEITRDPLTGLPIN